MWKQSFGIALLAPATTGTKGRMGLRPYWWGLHCTLHTYRTQGRASLDCSNQRWQKPSLKSHPNSIMLPLGKSPVSNNKNIQSMVTSWKGHQLLWKVQAWLQREVVSIVHGYCRYMNGSTITNGLKPQFVNDDIHCMKSLPISYRTIPDHFSL